MNAIHVCGWGTIACHTACVEVRGRLMEASSLFPPSGFQESNSGLRAWQKVPLPAGHLDSPVCLLLTAPFMDT